MNSDDFNNNTLQIQSLSSGLQNSSWPMKCQNSRHTSQSPYSTKDNPHTEKWRYRTGWDGYIESQPVIGKDGTIYFGSRGSDRKLYAINPDGTKKWSYQMEGSIWRSSPAIAKDGTEIPVEGNASGFFKDNTFVATIGIFRERL